MSAVKHYIVNMLAQGLGRVLATGSTLFVFVLAARILSLDAFGQYSLIMALINVLAVISQMGSNEAMGKAVVEFGRDGLAKFIGNFLTLRLLLGIFAVAVGLVIASLIRVDLRYPLLLCAVGVPLVSMRFFDPIFQVQERPIYSVVTSLIYSVLLIGFSIGAFLFATDKLLALVIAYVSANAFYFVASLALLRRIVKFRLQFERGLMWRIFWLAAPLGPATLYAILNNRADIFILGYLTTDDIVGLYSAAYRLVDFLAIASVILISPLVPIFSKIVPENPRDLAEPLEKSFGLAGFLAVPLALAMPFFSPWLIAVLFGPGFAGAEPLMNILVWVVIVVLLSLLSSGANLALGAMAHGYWSGAVAVLVNVGLNFWWIPEYGAVAAAVATLVSGTVWLLISYYYTHRELGSIFHWRLWSVLAGLNLFLWILLYPLGMGHSLGFMLIALALYFMAAWFAKVEPMISIVYYAGKLRRKLAVGESGSQG